MITDEEMAQMSNRLEEGFFLNFHLLKRLESATAQPLIKIHEFGKQSGKTATWLQAWDQHWDSLTTFIRRLQVWTQELELELKSTQPERLTNASELWAMMKSEDEQVTATLGHIRILSAEFDAAQREAWNKLAGPMKSHLQTLMVCAQVLWIKLSLLKETDRSVVESRLQTIFARLPGHPTAVDLDAIRYLLEYQGAVSEIANEHHQELGFFDAIKALFMWVDQPVVIAPPDRSLQVPIAPPAATSASAL